MPVPWPIFWVAPLPPGSWLMKSFASADCHAVLALAAVVRLSTPIVPISPWLADRYVARATWLQPAQLIAVCSVAPMIAPEQSVLMPVTTLVTVAPLAV